MKIGEWLFLFREYLHKIAPKTDKIRIFIEEIDNKYNINCRRNNIGITNEIMTDKDIIISYLSRICRYKVIDEIMKSIDTEDYELFIEYSDEILKQSQIIENRNGIRNCGNLSVLKAFANVKKELQV